jgi:Protein of unknown function (DUF1570)
MKPMNWLRMAVVMALWWSWCLPRRAEALDYVTVREGDRERELVGKVEVEAADGGVLLLTADGAMWSLPRNPRPEDPVVGPPLVRRRTDEKPFVPLTREALSKQLAAELPTGFRIHTTQHYLLCYNTSPGYAQWVGALFERLYKGFYNYWTKKGAVLHDPQFPLVALVFDGPQAFQKHAAAELGAGFDSILGYYSLKTNRMTMVDLTGVEGQRLGNQRTAGNRIQQILSQPGAERTVATIVHEATHQLAFNSGLQVRFADVPFWVSEGVAIYFETPDLDNAKGWRSIGSVNQFNLANFRRYLPSRPAGSLPQLLMEDKRFRDPAAVNSAYAEAWALNYFLLRTRDETYVRYLQALAGQTPLVTVTPEERLKQFQEFFGEDLAALEAEFLRHMRGVN